MPPIKSVDPVIIGPKKSKAQKEIIIHMSLFHLNEVKSFPKERPFF